MSRKQQETSRLRIRPAAGSHIAKSKFEADSRAALEACRAMALEHETACVVETWVRHHRGRGPGDWQLVTGFNERGIPCQFRKAV